MEKLPLALAMGVLVLALVIVAPVLIDSSIEDNEINRTVSENETVAVNEHLQLHADDIKPSQGTLNVTVTDVGTDVSVEKALNEGQTTLYEHPSGNVSIDVVSVTDPGDGDQATLTVVYDTYFGWNDGATALMENLPIILMLVVFIIIAVMVKGVINV
jgi:hypothetical protein